MYGRQTNIPTDSQRFFQANLQSILVAAGYQCRACRRTDRRVGIRLEQANAFLRYAIDIRCAEVGAAVTGYVGIPEVVSHDEDDVRRTGRSLRKYIFGT